MAGAGGWGARGRPLTTLSRRVVSLPYSSNGLQITPFGQSVQLVARQLELELVVMWGPGSHLLVRTLAAAAGWVVRIQQFAWALLVGEGPGVPRRQCAPAHPQVLVEKRHMGKLCGLCGDFNGKQTDEFLSEEGRRGLGPRVPAARPPWCSPHPTPHPQANCWNRTCTLPSRRWMTPERSAPTRPSPAPRSHRQSTYVRPWGPQGPWEPFSHGGGWPPRSDRVSEAKNAPRLPRPVWEVALTPMTLHGPLPRPRLALSC